MNNTENSNIYSNERIALQTVVGLKFVNKSSVVLIQYLPSITDKKLTWTVMLETGEHVRLKLNITAKDILESLHRDYFIQISQTIIINVDYLSFIELKTRKCIFNNPFDKLECYVSRLYLKNIRQQYELLI